MTATDYLVEIETLPPQQAAPSSARSHPLGVVALGVILPSESAIGAPEILRLASRDFVSLPSDTLPNTPYAGKLIQPLAYERSVVDSESPVGRIGLGGGDIVIANGDGFLDALLNNASLVGRAVTVKSVPRGAGLDAAAVDFTGVVDAIERGARLRVSVVTRDALAGDFANQTFAGTGGAEGGADLAGKPKPAAFGHVFGIAPTYLGLIAGRNSHMASGGLALPLAGIDAIYDRGELVPQVAFPPVAGQASVDLATGIITLGGPAAGRLTADVRGYAPLGALAQTTADIIQAILEDFQGIATADIDTASLAQLNTDQPAPVGIWVGTDKVAALALIQGLRRGATLWGGANRAGKLAFGQLKMPAGPAVASFDRTDSTIVKVPGPAVINPPAFRHEVGYKRNYTVSDDASAAASDTQRAFMAERFRTSTPAVDFAIQFRSPTAGIAFTPGMFKDKADADAEAARKLALFDGRGLYEVTTGDLPPAVDIGATVALTEADFGLAATLGTVVRFALDRRRGAATLSVVA